MTPIHIEEEIEYFKDYKKRLYQFVICNACYTKGYRPYKRITIDAHEMLELLKEISRIELYIYKLKIQFSFREFESY
jgi:hypothetical protein